MWTLTGRPWHRGLGRLPTLVHGVTGWYPDVMTSIGHNTWVIPEGYVHDSNSYEGAQVLNTSDVDTHVQITFYLADREPAGPYVVVVPARRTRQIRFADLTEPEPVPSGTSYSAVVVSDRPVVVQHSRVDIRQLATASLPAVGLAESGNKLERGL
ncbi:hypothetical protein GCM10029964_064430 [Kibdelosporangium lantanae]